MVLFVSMSYSKFAETLLTAMQLAIMKLTVHHTLKLSLVFLKKKDLSQRRRLETTKFWLFRINTQLNLINLRTFFVGVAQEGNCKDSVKRDSMTKKNTRISRPSVYLVCYTKIMNNSNIAYPLKLRKQFVGCNV